MRSPLFGRGREIRTPDTQFWRLLLYQLNYTPLYAGTALSSQAVASQVFSTLTMQVFE